MRFFAITSVVLALALFAILFGCTQGVENFSLNEAFAVKEGAVYQNLSAGLSVKVISFADSRCPKNVLCVWAGEQGINLLVSAPNFEDTNVYLGETTKVSQTIDFKGDALGFTLVSINVDNNTAEIKVTLTPRDQVACTMDAKMCPDGSAVGRVPPLCNFSPCPGE